MPVNFLRNDSFDSKGKIEVWFNRLLIISLSNTVCYVLKEGVLTFTLVRNFVSASLPLVIGHLFWGFGSKNWQSFYQGLWLQAASWEDNVR